MRRNLFWTHKRFVTQVSSHFFQRVLQRTPFENRASASRKLLHKFLQTLFPEECVSRMEWIQMQRHVLLHVRENISMVKTCELWWAIIFLFNDIRQSPSPVGEKGWKGWLTCRGHARFAARSSYKPGSGDDHKPGSGGDASQRNICRPQFFFSVGIFLGNFDQKQIGDALYCRPMAMATLWQT